MTVKSPIEFAHADGKWTRWGEEEWLKGRHAMRMEGGDEWRILACGFQVAAHNDASVRLEWRSSFMACTKRWLARRQAGIEPTWTRT